MFYDFVWFVSPSPTPPLIVKSVDCALARRKKQKRRGKLWKLNVAIEYSLAGPAHVDEVLRDFGAFRCKVQSLEKVRTRPPGAENFPL